MSGKKYLHAPCGNCPFRKDRPFYLDPRRARKIAASFTQGDFTCHKTIDYDRVDEDGETLLGGPGEKVCGGMIGMMKNEGFSNQTVRIAERLGMIDWEKVDGSNVYDSRREFVEAMDALHGVEPDETPHCEISGPGCEDPAGWMTSSGVVENLDPGKAEVECQSCGDPMCPGCVWEENDAFCVNCGPDEDE